MVKTLKENSYHNIKKTILRKQAMQKMIDGVTKIIEIEETLAANPGLTPMQALAKVGK